MIKISRTDIYGFEAAIRGMRNPMNSWEKSDSLFDIDDCDLDGRTICDENEQLPSGVRCDWEFWIGPNDLDLMQRLAKSGTEHSKYRRMIPVWLDITAPLYWWKEMDTYMTGTVRNSCSTMHKIAAKEFEIDDFSHDHLIAMADVLHDLGCYTKDLLIWNALDLNNQHYEIKEGAPVIATGDYSQMFSPWGVLSMTIDMLNRCRKLYLETKDKKYWWQMIQLLPSSYNQKRTVMLNYEVLAKIYRERKNHKLDEWHTFCDWIKTLPYAKEVITLDN